MKRGAKEDEEVGVNGEGLVAMRVQWYTVVYDDKGRKVTVTYIRIYFIPLPCDLFFQPFSSSYIYTSTRMCINAHIFNIVHYPSGFFFHYFTPFITLSHCEHENFNKTKSRK